MKLKKMMALVLCATTVAGLVIKGSGKSSDNRNFCKEAVRKETVKKTEKIKQVMKMSRL